MRFVFLGVLVFLSIAAFVSAFDRFDLEIIDKVNSAKISWTARPNENFEGYAPHEIKSLLGWKKNTEHKMPYIKSYPENFATIPTSFNSSTQWPQCPSIWTIQNQARCGSCWAFGCIEAVTDRFCIHSANNTDIQLSFMDITTCDPFDDGCAGGDAGTAWEYVKKFGVVTAACSNYTIPTCPPEQQPCLNFVNTPPCKKVCSDGEQWLQSKHFVQDYYAVSSKVTDIQTEIMTNGPVEACFTVYEDFVHYSSGVYVHTTGQALGGHCIKILGWGVENNLPYWLCANSWTPYWGDQGFFKIVSGRDECGIESDVVAGMPLYS